MESVYKLKVVGGLNFTERKCIFSLDGKLLLTIATNCILIFVVDDGSPYGTLTITSEENKSSRKSSFAEDICNIVLNPYSPESSVISFTNRGRITFWNYLKVNQIKEFNIFSSLYPDIQSSLTLLYGLVVKPENDDDNISDLTIYHATMFCDKPYLYYCTIGQIEQMTKSCVSKDKPRKSKAGSQVSLDRLKSMATNIRYDPDRALVGIVTGARNKFLAAIDGNFINIIHLPYSTTTGGIAHKQARNFFTCLTAHATEYLLAAGDSLGRVHIYREDFCFSHQPIRSITHWHHSPVADLCFSPSGSYLYSGGFESVLVRWDISFSHENNFYPRLGSPIRYVICDSLNQKILTCHENNTFHCVGSTFDVNFPALGGLTLLPPTDFLRAPQNISWDPKSSSIVLRGKCGHLQFYSPFKEQQLFQLDVVGMNYLPPEVDRVIINVDVARFCVSSNGEWISTLEYREDGVMMPEMRLKFWQYLDSSENKYKLNSCIHLPHKKPVNKMKFSQDSNFMVTTSRDTEFKIWHLVKEDSGKPDGKTYWICGRVGNLNRFSTPEEIAVSSDFSLLAISFGSNVTIWDTSDYNLESRGTFVPPKDSHLSSIDQTILSIGFGSDIQSNLLFETRSSSVRVCDLLNYSVKQLWKPPKNTYIKFNLYDDQKNRMACYLTNGTVVLLDTEKEIAKITLSHATADVRLMVCGIFSPLPRVSEDPIFSHHGMILIDQSQKVYAIGLSDNKVEELSLSGPIDDELDENLTPFARMCKEERYKVKKEEKLKQLELNQYLGPSITRKKLIEDVFIKVSSHILPPVEKFCTSFLTSLLQLSSSNSSNDPLSYLHLLRQIDDYGGYSIDITGPTMIIVQKVSSLAFCLHDGHGRPEKDLTPEQKALRVTRVPTLLEFLSYVFHFPSVMCGPLVYFKNYLEFIDGTNFSKHIESPEAEKRSVHPGKAILKKLFISVFFAIMIVVYSPKFPISKLCDDKFLAESSFIMVVAYMLASTASARFKYYFAWTFGEACCNAAGIGFNGFNSKNQPNWDLLDAVDILRFEFSRNLREALEAWNKTTQSWLRRSAYERAPRFRMLATYILSAMWHGFYPGYYLTFLSGALFTQGARTARRCLRHHFQSSKWLSFVYDIITCLFTRIMMAYLVFPFVMLAAYDCWKVYCRLYFFGHVIVLLGIFVLPRIIKPLKKSQNVNGNEKSKTN